MQKQFHKYTSARRVASYQAGTLKFEQC